MTNLLKETLGVLECNNKTLDDVEWIGDEHFFISKEDFLKKADKYYDAGYGCAEVNMNLTICGKDFWLERHEYDGSEWWEYKTMPQKPLVENKEFIFGGRRYSQKERITNERNTIIATKTN